MILTPKNWQSFQHYKDRNPPWIKLHKSLLDDFEFQSLPDASKALAPMLWLLASETMDGVIKMSDDALTFRLRKSIDQLVIALQPLVTKGFFTCDSILLANGYHHAEPEERRVEEKRDREETEEKQIESPMAPVLLQQKKAKKEPKVRTTALKPESVKAFQTTWGIYPATFRKWENGQYVDDPVSKGSKMVAEKNFQAIVDSRVATPAELCYALQAYVAEGIEPKKGYFQHLSTFFGPQKATYLEWLDRAREIALEVE